MEHLCSSVFPVCVSLSTGPIDHLAVPLFLGSSRFYFPVLVQGEQTNPEITEVAGREDHRRRAEINIVAFAFNTHCARERDGVSAASGAPGM